MAVGDAHVLPGFFAPVLTHFSFQGHRLLLSHISAEVSGENKPERRFASTGYRTHNHQVMSPTLSSLSYPDKASINESLAFTDETKELHKYWSWRCDITETCPIAAN